MAGHEFRAGKKFASSHTTATPIAGKVADLAEKMPEVTKISLGIITAGLSSPRHGARVTFKEDTGCILLSVRSSTTLQEMRVYGSDLQHIKLQLAKQVRDAGWRIGFR